MPILLLVIILGIVEGVTEYLPVSSTGHLILVGDILGFTGPPGRLFEITIQLGAILAICVLYAARLTRLAVALPHDPGARRVFLVILVGFLPAALIGVIAHDFITSILFSPYVVCVSLVLGGVAILVIERCRPRARYHDIGELPLGLALKIGLFQSLAMIPGVSRSGATILGAVLLGVDRRTAAEYSFLLAIPTMLGATTVSLASHWEGVDQDGVLVVGSSTNIGHAPDGEVQVLCNGAQRVLPNDARQRRPCRSPWLIFSTRPLSAAGRRGIKHRPRPGDAGVTVS